MSLNLKQKGVYNGNNSNINWGRLFHRVCCDSYTRNNGNFRLGGMMVNIYIRNKKDGKVSEDQMLGFDFDGFFITDPYFSECMRFEVDPIEYYGLTKEQTKLFKKQKG